MSESRSPPVPVNVPHQHRSRRVLRGNAVPSQGFNGLLSMIQDLIGEDGQVVIEQLVQRGGGGDAVLELTADGAAPIRIAHIVSATPANHHHSSPPSGDLDDPSRDFSRDAQEFVPAVTQQRWTDEAKMTQGKAINERLATLANYVVLALLPEAREKAKLKAEQEEEAARLVEKAKELEVTVAAPPDPTERPAETSEPEASPSAQDAIPLAQPIVPDVEMTVPHAPEGQTLDPSSAMSLDESTPPILSTDTDTADVETTTPLGTSPQEERSSSPANAPESDEAGPSETTRVTVLINGSSVDITDTGIDPTFLEALPDDMREEILNQHFRDRRAAERTEAAHESQISQEFLDALPPEIRNELLQQERDGMERARRERERAAADTAAPPAGPAEIDPASFLASLEPALRQAVLMEQEQDFLQSLPPQLLAEATAILEDSHPPRRTAGRAHPSNTNTTGSRKVPVQRDAIQLLDRAGVATLARLLFFPEVLKKNSLHKVLGHLCENTKTRMDLFNLLLGILQDGMGELAFVDKSFSQLSFRTPKVHATPSKSSAKQKNLESHQSGATLSSGPTDGLSDLVAQRCLEALTFIVTANDSSAAYFLSEQESSVNMRKSSSRKGKGKEKSLPQTHYPLVLLLSLLDRDGLLKSSPMMESVAGLLANITRPLSTLKDSAPKVTETAAPVPVPVPASAPAPAPVSESNAGSIAGTAALPSAPSIVGEVEPAPGTGGKFCFVIYF